MAFVMAQLADGGGSIQHNGTVSGYNNKTFIPLENEWDSGRSATVTTSDTLPDTTPVSTKIVDGSYMDEADRTSYQDIEVNNLFTKIFNGPEYEQTEEELKRLRMPEAVKKAGPIFSIERSIAWQKPQKRNEMLNEDKSNRQNSAGFPYYIQPSTDLLAAKYDYRIIPNDDRYPATRNGKLEDKLKEARASLGIHVHGNNDIARAVKYYMYNRFKVPDHNLAFNRMTTHVFFTRPDLNLLDCYEGMVVGAVDQVVNHSDASLIYNTHPFLFKLLTDNKRCNDSNNFNFLLSQQVASFNIDDEELEVADTGKSWSGHSIPYGIGFNGTAGGEFSCTFNETQDLEIITLLRLWTMYIYNVSRGAWKPSYDLMGRVAKGGNYEINSSHVFTKTLDYGASVYVFKCAPDGEHVLYWTKYFGVFPVNTGTSTLSWSAESGISESPKLDIKFRYAYKKSMSPISLIEFNEQSEVGKLMKDGKTVEAEASFNPNYNHSSRPYVGAPFIEMKLANPGVWSEYRDKKGNLYNGYMLGPNADLFGKNNSQILLRFLKNTDARLSDNALYKASYS